MSAPIDLPEQLVSLRDHDWSPITLGRSEAAVWRIGLGNDNAVFLKAAPAHGLSELPGEADRLDWLARTGFKAPRRVEMLEASDRHYLLMTAVPGTDLTHYRDDPEALCRIYAQGLRRLHALDPTHCPFDHSLDRRLADAKANVAAGRVDETDFDADRQGWTATHIMDWLLANRPPTGDRIVTHGDACLPNLMALDGRFSGMVDCGRLGTADAWQDLALACRSLIYNCGAQYIPAFLAAYGAEWDEARYRYYCTLDELF